MESIILYKNLREEEKKKVYEFMNQNTDYINSMDQMDNTLNSEIYDFGSGVLFYFINDKVVASVCVVLEMAKNLNTAFIHKVIIDSTIENIDKIVKKLIQESITIANNYEAYEIRLAFDEKTFKVLEKYGYKYEYRAIEMFLKDNIKKYETLNLKELSDINKNRYVEIYNDSFSDMPHGTIIDFEDVNEFLEKDVEKDNKSYYFIVCDNEKEIGFMEASIDNSKGMFDIGLCKKYRGMGYGYRLLESAIQFLVKKNVAEIALIVIDDNKRAYKMYEKRGFHENYVKGYWSKL